VTTASPVSTGAAAATESTVVAPISANSSTETNSTEDSAGRRLGVEGESGLDACFRRIIAAGGCSAHTPTNMFVYDEDSGSCGCCSSLQVTTVEAENFASAVYTYRQPTISSAPDHCISGSTMFYPDAAGGADVAHACECGSCTTCGAGNARYMDWSGPFVIPDSVGAVSFADGAKTQPLYDPVDSCLCDDSSPSQCELEPDQLAVQSSSAASALVGVGGVFSSNAVVLSSALVMFIGFVRRG